VANDLGIDAIAGFMKHFGFGERTGIDLQGEATGVLPSPEWKIKRFKRPEQQKWYAGETISIGIGQGYNAYTPIQLAQAMATSPTAARCTARISSPTSMTRAPASSAPSSPSWCTRCGAPRSPRVREARHGRSQQGRHRGALLRQRALHQRRQDRDCAAHRHQAEREYDESKVAERLRDHSLFIAFAPLENPKIALSVVVENGGLRRARRRADRAHGARLLPARKLPQGMQQPTPEDETDEEKESD